MNAELFLCCLLLRWEKVVWDLNLGAVVSSYHVFCESSELGRLTIGVVAGAVAVARVG